MKLRYRTYWEKQESNRASESQTGWKNNERIFGVETKNVRFSNRWCLCWQEGKGYKKVHYKARTYNSKITKAVRKLIRQYWKRSKFLVVKLTMYSQKRLARSYWVLMMTRNYWHLSVTTYPCGDGGWNGMQKQN